jgi:hypothetical protein
LAAGGCDDAQGSLEPGAVGPVAGGRKERGRRGSGRVGWVLLRRRRVPSVSVVWCATQGRDIPTEPEIHGPRWAFPYETPSPRRRPVASDKGFFFTEYSLLPHAIRFHGERASKIFFFLL